MQLSTMVRALDQNSKIVPIVIPFVSKMEAGKSVTSGDIRRSLRIKNLHIGNSGYDEDSNDDDDDEESYDQDEDGEEEDAEQEDDEEDDGQEDDGDGEEDASDEQIDNSDERDDDDQEDGHQPGLRSTSRSKKYSHSLKIASARRQTYSGSKKRGSTALPAIDGAATSTGSLQSANSIAASSEVFDAATTAMAGNSIVVSVIVPPMPKVSFYYSLRSMQKSSSRTYIKHQQAFMNHLSENGWTLDTIPGNKYIQFLLRWSCDIVQNEFVVYEKTKSAFNSGRSAVAKLYNVRQLALPCHKDALKTIGRAINIQCSKYTTVQSSPLGAFDLTKIIVALMNVRDANIMMWLCLMFTCLFLMQNMEGSTLEACAYAIEAKASIVCNANAGRRTEELTRILLSIFAFEQTRLHFQLVPTIMLLTSKTNSVADIQNAIMMWLHPDFDDMYLDPLLSVCEWLVAMSKMPSFDAYISEHGWAHVPLFPPMNSSHTCFEWAKQPSTKYLVDMITKGSMLAGIDPTPAPRVAAPPVIFGPGADRIMASTSLGRTDEPCLADTEAATKNKRKRSLKPASAPGNIPASASAQPAGSLDTQAFIPAISRSCSTRVSRRKVNKSSRRGRAPNVSCGSVAGHSCRQGFWDLARRRGLSTELTAILNGWEGEAMKRYDKPSAQSRREAAEAFSGHPPAEKRLPYPWQEVPAINAEYVLRDENKHDLRYIFKYAQLIVNAAHRVDVTDMTLRDYIKLIKEAYETFREPILESKFRRMHSNGVSRESRCGSAEVSGISDSSSSSAFVDSDQQLHAAAADTIVKHLRAHRNCVSSAAIVMESSASVQQQSAAQMLLPICQAYPIYQIRTSSA